MSLTSLTFLFFTFLLLVVYFLVPRKAQWIVLLAFSLVFYASFGIKYVAFILFSAVTIFGAGQWMTRLRDKQKQQVKALEAPTREEKKQLKAACNRKRKAVFVATLLVNLGILIFFKYAAFLWEQVGAVASLFHAEVPGFVGLAAPIGISFYTFQSLGYLIDIYWENYPPEKNVFRFLLFVSFFPQTIQGPIQRYDALSKELFAPHTFIYKNFSYGCQRMLWGFFKKMVIADSLALNVQDVFANYSGYTGWNVMFGALLYSVQIYADFSGYMDIVCGFGEILGIRMAENFERPYFSKSVAEYWRRWHITLGAWFKDYIYYPIACSKRVRKFGKKTGKVFSKHVSGSIPAVVALIGVWLVTGLWHGASWNYVIWGGLNGFFIILSVLLEPTYKKMKTRLKVNENSRLWAAFQTLRTFALVTLIKVFPEVGTASSGVGFIRQMFTHLSLPHGVWDILLPQQVGNQYLFLFPAILLLFVSSLIQRKQPIRDFLQRCPRFIRWGIFLGLALTILLFGVNIDATGGGFMYAQF